MKNLKRGEDAAEGGRGSCEPGLGVSEVLSLAVAIMLLWPLIVLRDSAVRWLCDRHSNAGIAKQAAPSTPRATPGARPATSA